MKKKEKKKEGEILDTNMPEDAKSHESGVWYREFEVDGLDNPVRLFNSSSPKRLDFETKIEYKVRRKFLNHKSKLKYSFYDPYQYGTTKGVPYVNKNKKDKFKKVKK
jgi:hypothetical protein